MIKKEGSLLHSGSGRPRPRAEPAVCTEGLGGGRHSGMQARPFPAGFDRLVRNKYCLCIDEADRDGFEALYHLSGYLNAQLPFHRAETGHMVSQS